MTREQGFRYVDPEPPRFAGNQAWDAWARRRDAFMKGHGYPLEDARRRVDLWIDGHGGSSLLDLCEGDEDLLASVKRELRWRQDSMIEGA
jgi:hypothetical protein